MGLQPLKVTEEVVGLPLRKPSGEPSDGKTEANSNRNSPCGVRVDRNRTGQEKTSESGVVVNRIGTGTRKGLDSEGSVRLVVLFPVLGLETG